ncbi:MAG: CoA-binding protein, partial [Actinobacteria bacterium]|nr:CoA-binding protein [Actinomycetota bacterium]
MKSPDDEIIGSFLESNVYAVIGVSPDMSKYGYKVYEDLKNGGYTVYAVNPGYDSIYGEKCYPDLKSLPEKPDVVEFVCPPKVTEK